VQAPARDQAKPGRNAGERRIPQASPEKIVPEKTIEDLLRTVRAFRGGHLDEMSAVVPRAALPADQQKGTPFQRQGRMLDERREAGKR
jgi:hypothetical protein